MSRYTRHIATTSQHHIDDLRAVRRRLLTQDDAEALHDLRVGIRRLRSTLMPLTTLPSMSAIKKALKPFKKLADASNAIRDGEVQQRLLLDHALPHGGTALHDWRQEHQRRHRLARRKLKLRLAQASWKKWLKKLEKQLDQGLAGCKKQKLNAQLQASHQALLAQLRRDLADLSGLFSEIEHWHHIRLNCKRLRYLLESHGERLTPNWEDQARYVKAAQDSLGELRDWEVLGASLAADKVPVDPGWYMAEHAIRRQQAEEDCTALANVLITGS